MMRNLFLSLFILTGVALRAQPTWLWAKSFPTSNISEGVCIDKDDSGNVIMAGGFADTMTIGNTTLISNTNYYDILLAKFDANGNPVWARTASPGSSSVIYGVKTNDAGDIYVCGMFSGSQMTIGSFTLSNSAAGQLEVFIAKYDRLGNVIWAHSAGGQYNDQASSLSIDANGDVYISGYFESNFIIFGQDTLQVVSILGSPHNFFLAKYDQAGNVLWAKCGTGHAWVGDAHVAADSVGNVYLTGYYYGTDLVFDGDSLTQAVYNHSEMFVTRYTSSGNEVWAKQWENDLGIWSFDICTDHANDIILCGKYDSVVQHFDNFVCTPYGPTNAYLLKLNPNGVVQWVVAPQSNDEFSGSNVAVDANDEILFTGGVMLQQHSTIIFGTDTFYYPVNTPDPAFIMLFNSSGILQCGQTIISGGDDYLAVVEGAFPGSFYLTGDMYMSPVVFGTDTLSDPAAWEYACLLNWGCGKIGAVDEMEEGESISIFPNPATDEIQFASANQLSGNGYFICDETGRMVMEGKIEAGNSTLDVSALAPGIYFVRIIDRHGNASAHKFIVSAH